MEEKEIITNILINLKGKNIIQGLEEVAAAINIPNLKKLEEIRQIIAKEVTIPLLLSFLETKNSKQLELAISICHSVFTSKVIAFQFLKEKDNIKLLSSLMNHDEERVRKLPISILLHLSSEDEQKYLFLSEDLLRIFMKSFSDESMVVFKESEKVLNLLSNTKSGLLFLEKSGVLNYFKESTKNSSIQRFRIYELLGSISSISKESFGLCEKSGIFNDLFKELKENDNPLDMANLLEILKLIGQTKFGLEYIQESKVFDHLIKNHILKVSDEITTDFLLRIMTDFSAFGEKSFELLVPEKTFEKLFENLDLTDGKRIDLTLSFIGSICSQSKKALSTLSEQDLSKYVQFITSSDPELMLSFLHSFSLIFESNIHSTSELKEFYDKIESKLEKLTDKKMVAIVMDIVMKPFPDIRSGGFHLFKSLCTQTWAIKEFLKYPNLIKYLLDRTTETFKETKEWKFTVIDQIVKTVKHEKELIDVKELQSLKAYLLRGPFWVDAESIVEVESEVQ